MKFFFDKYGFTSGGALGSLTLGLVIKELWARGWPSWAVNKGILDLSFSFRTLMPWSHSTVVLYMYFSIYHLTDVPRQKYASIEASLVWQKMTHWLLKLCSTWARLLFNFSKVSSTSTLLPLVLHVIMFKLPRVKQFGSWKIYMSCRDLHHSRYHKIRSEWNPTVLLLWQSKTFFIFHSK